MTATQTQVCQHPECSEEFVPSNWGNRSYCSAQCGKDAYRLRNRGESAVILHDHDRENVPARTSKMTGPEFDGYLLRLRTELDAQPACPHDRHWRRDEIAKKVAKEWTIGQMARWFRLDREDMQTRIDELEVRTG